MYRFDDEEKQAIWRVIESGWLFRYGGEPANLRQVQQFEEQFARRMEVPYAVAVTSGTAALICALAGLGIGPGDEVIVPGYTFIATASAVVNARAVPIIAEVDEKIPALKRATVTLIDDRREGDSERLQLSNFFLLENREDHSIEVYLTRLGEDPDDFWGAHAYKYTLRLR